MALDSKIVTMENVIKFYNVSDKFGEFSNFAAHPIKLKGKKWPTSEHYFQAMKFESAVEKMDYVFVLTNSGEVYDWEWFVFQKSTRPSKATIVPGLTDVKGVDIINSSSSATLTHGGKIFIWRD